jgi:hypothetical protein
MRPALPFACFVLLVLGLSACAPEGPSAFVTFNIPPNGSCVVSPDSTVFRAYGLYDISPGGNGRGNYCEKPYILNLLVNSYLRSNSDDTLGRAEPNILQIHSAEVRIMSLDKVTLEFTDSDPPLPNPFLVTTNNSLFPARGDTPSMGIASVEAIPVAYAPYLSGFTGDQILAEVQIFGTTTGDVDVDFKPFVYPIQICDGCQTLCASQLVEADGTTRSVEDVYGEACPDDAGADGRICLDRGC